MKIASVKSASMPIATKFVDKTRKVLADSLGKLAVNVAGIQDASDKKENAQYEIDSKLAQKYNQKQVELASNKQLNQSFSEISNFMAKYGSQDQISSEDAESFGLNVSSITSVEKGQPIETKPDFLPSQDVIVEMFDKQAKSVLDTGSSRLSEQAKLMLSDKINTTRNSLESSSIVAKAKEIRAAEDLNIQDRVQDGDYDSARAMNLSSSKTAIAKANTLIDINKSQELSLSMNAMVKAKTSGNIKELNQMISFYANNGNSVTMGSLPPSFMAFLADKEAAGYSTLNGTVAAYSDPDIDVTKMTIDEVIEFQVGVLNAQYNSGSVQRGKGTSAVGKYQIVSGTLKRAAEELGIKGDELFDQGTQDFIASNFLLGSDRPKLQAFINGSSDDINAAAKQLVSQWEGAKHLSQSEMKTLLNNMRSEYMDPNENNSMDSAWHNQGGDTLSNLTPRERLSLVNEMRSVKNSLSEKKKAQLGAEYNIIKDSAKVIMGQVETGGEYNLSEANVIGKKLATMARIKPTEGNLKAYNDWAITMALAPEIKNMAMHSYAESQSFIDQTFSGSNKSVNEIKAKSVLNSALGKIKSSIKSDSVAHAIRAGLVEPFEVDVSNQSGVYKTLMGIKNASVITKDTYGVTNVLSKDTQIELVRQLDGMSKNEKTQFLGATIEVFGNESQDLFKAAFGDSARMLSAGNLMIRDKNLGTNNNSKAAGLILAGIEIAKDLGSNKIATAETDSAAIEIIADEYLGGSFTGRNKQREDILDAAKYHYIATNPTSATKTFDDSKFKESINAVIGGMVIENADNEKFISPFPNYSQSKHDDYLDGVDPATVFTGDQAVAGFDSPEGSAYVFEQIKNGIYKQIQTSENESIIIDDNGQMLQQVYRRRTDGGVTFSAESMAQSGGTTFLMVNPNAKIMSSEKTMVKNPKYIIRPLIEDEYILRDIDVVKTVGEQLNLNGGY